MKLLNDILSKFSRSLLKESVFVYTFHKCASTLFATQVLNNALSLKHHDIHGEIYAKQNDPELINYDFKKSGFIYGPIRIVANKEGKKNKNINSLLMPLLNEAFIEGKRCLFIIRDPRDILVSSYYSFGFSHQLSSNPTVQKRQLKLRGKISNQTIDEYVITHVDQQIEKFNRLGKLFNSCKNGSILRYEDLINDYETFIDNFQNHIQLNQKSINNLYIASRPKEIEDPSSHHRSGQVGGYQKHLQHETIDILDGKLSNIIKKYHYASPFLGHT